VLSADVVIVGAGPAGASAAIVGAGAGLRVLLLNRPGRGGGRPGETLHPGVEPIFRQLGVAERVAAAGFVRHPGIRVRWDGPERLVAYGGDLDGPWRGYQAPAAELDALLVARAGEQGATLSAARAVRPVLTGGRVTGVQTTHGAVRAAFVVDAAGGGGWLARHLRLPQVRRSPALLARFGYRKGSCPAHTAVPMMRADERGWTWIARIGPSRYAWIRVPLDGAAVGHDWVPGELRELAACGRSRSADVSWRALSRPAGPGWLAVGDAAARLDPASSHGVLRAMMSGIAAGHAIHQAVTAPGCEEHVGHGYAAWLRDWFEHDATVLRELYGRHPRPPAWAVPG
jgi:flavin-dependent dehydrogenase